MRKFQKFNFLIFCENSSILTFENSNCFDFFCEDWKIQKIDVFDVLRKFENSKKEKTHENSKIQKMEKTHEKSKIQKLENSATGKDTRKFRKFKKSKLQKMEKTRENSKI